MEKEYVVPEGMLKAANKAVAHELLRNTGSVQIAEVATLATVKWLAENPIMPTSEQLREIFDTRSYNISMDDQQFYYAEWQRRMFLKPEGAVHPELQRWIDEARVSGWEPSKVVNLIRIFNSAYALGREDGAKNGRS